ncbi:MAG: extracellular solute-binding protein, partial [Armatimonadota bacterium]
QPEIEKVLRSYDNRIYAVPFFQVAQALYYRKDIYAKAGLDPNKPPRTWEEFEAYSRQIMERVPGTRGFVFSGGPGGQGYWWTNFVWQAGGEVLVPAERGYAKAVVNTPEAAKALEFYRRLTVTTWKGADGKTYGPIAQVTPTWSQDVKDGKVAMWFSYTNDVMLSMSDLNPALIGIARMPAGPAGSYNEINSGMWAINASIKDPKKIEACWRFIDFFVSQEAARISTVKFVDLGLEKLINPVLLKQFGYADLAGTVDPGYVEANEKLFQTGKPEPYGRNSQQVYLVLDGALDRARLDPNRPADQILEEVNQEMNRKLLGYIPEAEMNALRGRATTALVIVLLITAGLIAWAIRKARNVEAWVEQRMPAGTDRSRVRRFVVWCLLPACLSILVWAYYPLVKGLVIAFQDYRIMQSPQWVGLDNFINVFTSSLFWKSLMNSVIYVGLTIVMGFVLPILLALALNEIPRFTLFFRTVFYLPAMTSGIVIAFMWRQFYDRAETGLLNSLLAPIIQAINPLWMRMGGGEIPLAQDWLGDPKLAMFAVVLPGIWAGAGPGSILYLAALKNVPQERYEAADLDGAEWWHKIRYMTLPSLRPLILINLLGVFIAGFKAMENVFVLTGGGPLYSTHTVGLEIWTNAFMFLKFGYATAAAWVMGAILIGFTLIQIRSLTRMKFTAAKL